MQEKIDSYFQLLQPLLPHYNFKRKPKLTKLTQVNSTRDAFLKRNTKLP